jgi:hypothetical protein
VVKWVESKMVGGVSELTLLTPIKRGLVPGQLRSYEQRLADQLHAVQGLVDRGYPTTVSRLPTIHFARWVIIRPEQYLYYDKEKISAAQENPCVSWLLFTSNFDGSMKDYLRDFSVFLGEEVDRIWGNCEGYPERGSRDFEAYWAYAKKHQLTTQAFYNAYPGVSVPRIYHLLAFKNLFDEFVASTRGPDGRSIANLADAFDKFVALTANFPSAFPDSGGIFQVPVPEFKAEMRFNDERQFERCSDRDFE